ncbi:MAG: hypothetical protein P4L03_07975 [Terracidiphilus sp.]|nr:hypothetical protein [Terracidiphilus sp.]
MAGTQANKHSKWGGLFGLIPLAVWCLFVGARVHSRICITADSASYIDCARSIFARQGFLVRPWAGLGTNLWEPLAVFPPGYPILISIFMHFSPSAYHAALCASLFSAALFILFMSYICSARLPQPFGVMVGIAVVSMTAFIYSTAICLSESLFMLLMVISVICIIKAYSGSSRNSWWLFSAGFAGGLAWCTRNVAVALLLAIFVFVIRREIGHGIRRTAIATGQWLAGWVLASSWLVARNLYVFHRMNPYDMPPSTVSFTQNIYTYLKVVWSDLDGITAHPSRIGLLCLVAAAIGVTIVSIAIDSRFRDRSPSVRLNHIDEFLMTVFVFYTSVIIVARTRYQMDYINSRFSVPVYWIVLLEGSVLAIAFFQRFKGKVGRLAPAFLLAVIPCVQMYYSLAVYKADRMSSDNGLVKDVLATSQTLRVRMNAGQIVESDIAPSLRIFGDINARVLPNIDALSPTVDFISVAQMEKAGAEGRLWGAVIRDRDRLEKGDYGPGIRDLALAQTARYPHWRIYSLGGLLICEYSSR